MKKPLSSSSFPHSADHCSVYCRSTFSERTPAFFCWQARQATCLQWWHQHSTHMPVGMQLGSLIALHSQFLWLGLVNWPPEKTTSQPSAICLRQSMLLMINPASNRSLPPTEKFSYDYVVRTDQAFKNKGKVPDQITEFRGLGKSMVNLQPVTCMPNLFANLVAIPLST